MILLIVDMALYELLKDALEMKIAVLIFFNQFTNFSNLFHYFSWFSLSLFYFYFAEKKRASNNIVLIVYFLFFKRWLDTHVCARKPNES
jgi:hypothetical protein